MPGVKPGLVKVWEIVVPFDATAPLTVPVTAPIVQLKLVPETALTSAMFVVAELHIVVLPDAVTSGVGLIVIIMLTGIPAHEFAEGVTI